jgi:predicted metal-dependent peptidase
MDLDKVEAKLAAARTRLILDKPFLGALVLRLPMVAAKSDWCPTTATDARTFYYNPGYIAGLTPGQTQFILSHEALHCALSHFARRAHRVKHRWDLACDFAVNPLLIEDGLTPPPEAHIFPDYAGMTAEEIYPLLENVDDMETLDQHVYDQENQSGGSGQQPPAEADGKPDQGGRGDDGAREERSQAGGPGGEQAEREPEASSGDEQGERGPEDTGQGNREADDARDSGAGESRSDELAVAPPPLTQQEKETLQVQWQQRLAGAAQQAQQAGKLGGTIARMVDHLLQPQLPWRMLLARYMTATARDDFSFMRPSRREGDAILPSLRSSQIDLVAAVDTSGSIKADEIDEFLSEIGAIKGQMRARVLVLPCDSAVAEGAPWIFEPWEEITLPGRVTGGGGTDFRPVFQWLDDQGTRPDLLVYFTDAQGPFPHQAPNFPVIWLVKGNEKTPWGQRIQLN